MKNIAQNERPIGKYSNHFCFYSESIVKETEMAMLVPVYSDSLDTFENMWLPKSKMLAYNHIDNRDLVDDGKNYIKNPTFGMSRVQFFIPTFFVKESFKSQNMSQLLRELYPQKSDNSCTTVYNEF